MTGSNLAGTDVLIVEDSRTQAEKIRYILESFGCSTTVAANGKQALDCIRTKRPSVILTDILMPEMNGYDLCREVKADPTTSSIPVILVTQLFDPVDVVRGLECGADNFIIKPYEPGDIRTRLDLTLGRLHGQTTDDGRSIRINLPGSTHIISSGKAQILNILFSTYEVAVRRNAELLETHERLNLANDKLNQAVSELQSANAELTIENQERSRVEKALEDVNRKLHLMASITRHDLLNQLTAMRGNLDLALMYGSTEQDKVRELIRRAAEISTQSINTVEFTREYQKIGVKSPVWQDVCHLIHGSEKYTQTGAIRLVNMVPAGTEIFADPLIEKVFVNLMENAVKYGKTITQIVLRCEMKGETGRIICEDDGVGIPEEEKMKIFGFRYGSHTGLGLFLSKEILTMTGITICETGVYGHGARFEMHCPKGTLRVREMGGIR
jgi:DNA-binding response OmpR family regulator